MRYFLFSLILIFISCDGELLPADVDELGFEYYPLNVGEQRIYQLKAIDYKISGNDTLDVLLRETTFDSTVNSDQSITYSVLREIKPSDTSEWLTDSLWTIRKTDDQLVRQENNIPFVKLVFPVNEGISWNINAFNNKGEQEVFYTFDGTESDSLVKVIIEDIPANIVNQNQQDEIYARGVGLVSKNTIIYNFCTVDCDSSGQINSGRFLSQRLIEYVKE
jgi:hypothetical protein